MTDRLRAAAQAALDRFEYLESQPHVRGKDDCYEDIIEEIRAALVEDTHMGVHLTHCNQGLYEGVCKYCADDCPSLAEPEVDEVTKQEPVDDVWFEDRNGACRKSPRDCQRFGAAGVPDAVWVNGRRYTSSAWQGLTDEERRQILDSTHPDNRWTLAERVEYRLKERNA